MLAAVRTMWRNFETGMIDEFLREMDRRCQLYPILQPENHERN
jgi:hypothetical protein